GWLRILRALRAKQMEAFDLLLIGVRPDYQGMGVNAVIIAEQHPYFHKSSKNEEEEFRDKLHFRLLQQKDIKIGKAE
ncbi:MAG: hypothetical protein II096_04390, partial [Erysipelotrichaceae bacterium]|nr:hypothetical protein [Erysipelotrichaceae bacterium]